MVEDGDSQAEHGTTDRPESSTASSGGSDAHQLSGAFAKLGCVQVAQLGELATGEVYEVRLPGLARIHRVDDQNLFRYVRGQEHRRYDSGFAAGKVKLVAPDRRRWNLVIDDEGLARSGSFAMAVVRRGEAVPLALHSRPSTFS